MEQRTSDQEVDLLELLVKFFIILKSNKLLVIIFPMLGLMGGLSLAKYSKKERVESSMMIVTDLISENESLFLADQLEKGDVIQGLTKEQALQVERLQCAVKSGEEGNIYIRLTATIDKKEVLPALQLGFINYFNQAEPIKRHRVEKERFYRAMIKRIDIELAALGEVKKQLNTKLPATFFDSSYLFVKPVDLYSKKINYEIALEGIKSLQIVKGFGVITKKPTLSSTWYAVSGFLAGVLLVLLILFIKFFYGYYKRFEQTH